MHVHGALVATVFAAGRPVLVSDAVATGVPYFDADVTAASGAAYLPDGTLTGAVSLLDAAVRNVVGLGVPRTAALVAASIRPAAVLGLRRAAGHPRARRRLRRGGGLPRRADRLPSGVVTRYAAAMSEHPVAAHAVGEIAGQILEDLDGEPADLVFLFVSPHFAGTTEDVVGVLRAVLEPRALVGSTARRDRRRRPGGRGHARHLGVGRGAAPISIRRCCTSTSSPASTVVPTWWAGPAPDVALADPQDAASTLLLLADPFTFPVDGVLRVLGAARPGLQVIGGMASAAAGPGGNRLVADGTVTDRGAVGVLLGPGAPRRRRRRAGVSPGRPAVRGDRGRRQPRGGARRPDRARAARGARPLDERGGQGPAAARPARGPRRRRAQRRVRPGRLPRPQRARCPRGGRGPRPSAATVEVGQTLQFHIRDARAADLDLRAALAGRAAAGSLLFTCTGRGRRLFGRPDHDATAVRDAFGAIPVAGGFCAGELGPVGGRNHVHGFTASLALFH